MKPSKKSKIIACGVLDDGVRSNREIGRTVGIDHHAVARYLNHPLLNDPDVQRQLAHHRKNEIVATDFLIAKGRQRLIEYLDQEVVQPIPVLAIVDRSFQQRQLLEAKPTSINAWDKAQECMAEIAKLEKLKEALDEIKEWKSDLP